jgi:hypothetical protein
MNPLSFSLSAKEDDSKSSLLFDSSSKVIENPQCPLEYFHVFGTK